MGAEKPFPLSSNRFQVYCIHILILIRKYVVYIPQLYCQLLWVVIFLFKEGNQGMGCSAE